MIEGRNLVFNSVVMEGVACNFKLDDGKIYGVIDSNLNSEGSFLSYLVSDQQISSGKLFVDNNQVVDKESNSLEVITNRNVFFKDLSSREQIMLRDLGTDFRKRLRKSTTLTVDFSSNNILTVKPFEGLNPIAVKELTDNFHQLKARGKMILIVSSDIGSLYALCDEVLLFKDHQLSTVDCNN